MFPSTKMRRPSLSETASSQVPCQVRSADTKTNPAGKGQLGLYRLRIGTYRAVSEIDHSEQIVHVNENMKKADPWP